MFYVHSKRKTAQAFSVTLADVQKALQLKKKQLDLCTMLPKHGLYNDLADLFDKKKADILPPVRGKEVDYAIELEKENRREKEVP